MLVQPPWTLSRQTRQRVAATRSLMLISGERVRPGYPRSDPLAIPEPATHYISTSAHHRWHADKGADAMKMIDLSCFLHELG